MEKVIKFLTDFRGTAYTVYRWTGSVWGRERDKAGCVIKKEGEIWGQKYKFHFAHVKFDT